MRRPRVPYVLVAALAIAATSATAATVPPRMKEKIAATRGAARVVRAAPAVNFVLEDSPVPAAVLSNGTGDGSVSVLVDAFGAFGTNTPSTQNIPIDGDGNYVIPVAAYDPVGGYAPAETVYESEIFFGPLGNFLGGYYQRLDPEPSFVATGDAWALSRFSIPEPDEEGGWDFELVQELGPAGAAGSVLTQTYRVTNRTTRAQTFPMVRFVDGDLYYNEQYSNDWGGVANGGRVLYEFDTGDDRLNPVTYLGIQSFAGVHDGFTMNVYPYADEIVGAGGIPAADLGVVGEICIFDDVGTCLPGDGDGDGLTDYESDVTLSLQNTLTAAPGETVEFRTVTYWGSYQPSDAVAVDILDPNPILLEADAHFSQDVDKLARHDRVARGAAADGVSALVLRAVAPDAGEVTYSLVAPGGEDGTLTGYFEGGEPAGAVSVTPRLAADGRYYAAAAWTPPADYSPDEGDSSAARSVRLRVQGGSGASTVELALVRPPVLLVHDMWGGPEDFSDAFVAHLRDAGFPKVHRVDYRDRAVEDFDPIVTVGTPVEAVRAAYGRAMHELRSQEGIAAAQVDVVAHGTGGLVARAKVAWAGEPFLRTDTWQRGEFHKLITVGTPHEGTPLAAYLADGCGAGCRNVWAAAGHPIGPVMNALRPGSAAIGRLGSSGVPSHAIVGIAPDASATERTLDGWLAQADPAPAQTVDTLLGGDGAHDTFAPFASQSGGLPASLFAGVVHEDLSPAGADTPALASPAVQGRLLGLLQEGPGGGSFTNAANAAAGEQVQEAPGVATAEAADVADESDPPAAASLGLRIVAPAPGQVFAPGGRIPLAARVADPGNLASLTFVLRDRHTRLRRGTFHAASVVPAVLGPLEVVCVARDRAGRRQTARLQVGVAEPSALEELLAVQQVVRLSYPGQKLALGAAARFADGRTFDVSSPATGSVYTALSGGAAVVSLSPRGVLTAVGDGTEVVRISHGGQSRDVLVAVGVTNRPPEIAGLGDLALVPGRRRVAHFTCLDPDGDALRIRATLPPFGRLVDHGDGTASLVFTPAARHAGAWRAVVSVGDDGAPGLGDTKIIQVLVTP